MKAIVHHRYGPPEVAHLAELPKPEPKSNEILIRVITTTVNRTDSGFRSAEYVISRFWSGLLRPKFPVLGCEFAGVVESCGNAVNTFKPGDAMFGYNDQTFGGHAEYLCIAETAAVNHKPAGFSYDEAAALTEGAHYALCDIRAAKVQAGQEVMVYGATGAIGSAAVQLLKTMGVQVTAVCGTKHADLVRSLGADVVIDYQRSDFTRTPVRFDFIFDAVGKSSYGQCKPLLTEKGIYISTELGKGGENLWYALTSRFSRGKRLLFPLPTIKQADVLYLRDLAERGLFKPLIDRHYALEQIPEAYRYVETGQKTGNVIIRVAPEIS
jgi:NADPH:quinone reductase-like Zn-dependent oxidoreductase